MIRQSILQTVDVVKRYGDGETAVLALRGVTCEIYSREFVSLAGPSGSGKSTLINMLGGLEKPDDGSVLLNAVDLAGLASNELAYLRAQEVGYIFQNLNLNSAKTILENVTLPILHAGLPPEEADLQAATLLEFVGLGDRIHHRPCDLSVSQQIHVAIARAFANKPSIILADEPTGPLNSQEGQKIVEILRALNSEHGVTIVSATHDQKMLAASDRVFHIQDGQMTSIETRKKLFVEAELHLCSSGSWDA